MSVRFLCRALLGGLSPDVQGDHVVRIVSSVDLDEAHGVPNELRVLFARDPAYRISLERLLERGHVLEVRTRVFVSDEMRQAVECIARATQEGTVYPWLPRLLFERDFPTFTEREVQRAQVQGFALEDIVKKIVAYSDGYKRICIASLGGDVLDDSAREWNVSANQELSGYFLRYRVMRLMREFATPYSISWLEWFTLFLFGGLFVQASLGYLRVLGYFVASVLPDVWREGREAWALQRAGYTWRQLVQKMAPVCFFMAVNVALALGVSSSVAKGDRGWAGGLFSLSLITMSLGRGVQQLLRLRRSFFFLANVGKLRASEHPGLGLAWKEYCLHPIRSVSLFLLVGIPILSFAAFVVFPASAHNGWILVFLGMQELFFTKIALRIFFVWPYIGGRGVRWFFR